MDIKDIEFPVKPIDLEELDKELKEILGGLVAGVTPTDKSIIVHVDRDMDIVTEMQVRALYNAHDVTKIPPKPKRKTLDEILADITARLDVLERKNGITLQAGVSSDVS